MGAFEEKFGQFAFDDAGIGTGASLGEWMAGEVAPEALKQVGEEMGGIQRLRHVGLRAHGQS